MRVMSVLVASRAMDGPRTVPRRGTVRRASTGQPPKSAALSLVTISVPVSMLASTDLPLAASSAACDAELAHLRRELGDRRQLIAGHDRGDLVRAGVEADEQ